MRASNRMLLFLLKSHRQSQKIILVLWFLLTIPTGKPFSPTKRAISLERRSPSLFCAMIWTNKKFANIQQIAIPHSNISALILQTDDQDLFLISVYVPFSTNNRLADDIQLEGKINLLYNEFLHA